MIRHQFSNHYVTCHKCGSSNYDTRFISVCPQCGEKPPPKRNKYGIDISAKGKVARTVDGIVFDSKVEARYYGELKLRVKARDVVFFLRQVPFHLPGNTRYVVDFQEFHADGSVHFIDVKGRWTAAYVRNKKQVEALYPITIEEVK